MAWVVCAQELYEATGIELENLVYYRDETHYFVMTAKKPSLLAKRVLKKVHLARLPIGRTPLHSTQS